MDYEVMNSAARVLNTKTKKHRKPFGNKIHNALLISGDAFKYKSVIAKIYMDAMVERQHIMYKSIVNYNKEAFDEGTLQKIIDRTRELHKEKVESVLHNSSNDDPLIIMAVDYGKVADEHFAQAVKEITGSDKIPGPKCHLKKSN
jgi:hypothetical protein